MTHGCELIVLPRSQGVYHYTVTFGGEVLVADSRVPEYDACRALYAKGLRGTLAIARGGVVAIRMNIERVARAKGKTRKQVH